MRKNLVLTIIGKDRPGLVEAVADVVARQGGNWLESRMARLAGRFAGVLCVEVEAEQLSSLQAALGSLEGEGLRLLVDEAESGDSLAGTRLALELVGHDQPGIVHRVSQLLAELGVNVEELETVRQEAPMAGGTLFRARALVLVPRDLETARLRAALEQIGNELIVDIELSELEEEALAGHGSSHE